MRYDFAPMEGITDDLFRRLHHQYFPGTDRYYTPFLSPGLSGHILSKKEIRQILPENNPGIVLVPQLLTRQSEAFLGAASILADLGYREVNLNLGCPSGTVTAKGKGSGLLAPALRPELERFLEEIFSRSPLKISIKTRLGKEDPEDFAALLELYNRFPLTELIVHPRVQRDFYRAPSRMEWLRYAQAHSRAPVVLSGGIGTKADLDRLLAQDQAPDAVMLGRGLVADPALVKKCRGQPGPDKATYQAFCEELFDETAARLDNPRGTMFRMKELWSYFILLFDHRDKCQKALRKTTSLTEYQAVVARIFRELPLRDAADVNWCV